MWCCGVHPQHLMRRSYRFSSMMEMCRTFTLSIIAGCTEQCGACAVREELPDQAAG